jgi:KDO2-lipid IV(A) lauroyltransferase
MSAWGERASFHAYRAGAAIAQAIPLPLAVPLAEGIGRGAARLAGDRRLIVERNLRRTRGPDLEGAALRRAVGDTFAAYGRYWLELFRLERDAPDAVAPRFEAVGWEHIEDGLDAGRGVILALPHLGGFDFAAAWLAGRGAPPTVVVEPVQPPELFEWFARVRGSIGMEVVPLGPGAGRTILRALDRNRVVCLLSDRDLVGDGVAVELFGERTTMPGGPATLAFRTGAPLLPVATYYRPHARHFAKIGPPLPVERAGRLRDDVARVTQTLAGRFEELVRAAPEQWHLMQPNWESDRIALAARAARRGGRAR